MLAEAGPVDESGSVEAREIVSVLPATKCQIRNRMRKSCRLWLPSRVTIGAFTIWGRLPEISEADTTEPEGEWYGDRNESYGRYRDYQSKRR